MERKKYVRQSRLTPDIRVHCIGFVRHLSTDTWFCVETVCDTFVKMDYFLSFFLYLII